MTLSQKKTGIMLYNLYIGRAVMTLAAVCALCAFLYGFFLLEAVAHAAKQSQAQRQIGKLTAAVGSLEAQYLTHTKALTPERANELGFVTPASIARVYADAPENLSVNRNR